MRLQMSTAANCFYIVCTSQNNIISTKIRTYMQFIQYHIYVKYYYIMILELNVYHIRITL